MEFSYQPLQKDEFRVLELLPGPKCSKLRGKLHSYTVGNHQPYEAVSYCWALQQTDGSKISPEEGSNISPTLVSALRHLRWPDKSRYLWIDQVCVNQEDVAERNSQVQNMMGKIYSNADHLIIWLGNEGDSSQLAIHTIKRACDELESQGRMRDPYQVGHSSAVLSYVNLRDDTGKLDLKPWLAVINLLKRQWFQRTWVGSLFVRSRESASHYPTGYPRTLSSENECYQCSMRS